MEVKRIAGLYRFDKDKMQKIPIFETGRMFYDLYCLLPGQFQKVHSHAGEDKVYLVLEGRGVFDVGGHQQELGPGEAVIARAGEPHGVRNAAEKNLVLLVTMAPKPGGKP